MTDIKQENSNNPHGVGNPLDKSLRKVELEVLIPKVMREKAKVEKCAEEVKAFEECCRENSLFMIIKCQKPNNILKNCLGNWYQNEQFKSECKEIYLQDRTEYRSTGIQKKHRISSENK